MTQSAPSLLQDIQHFCKTKFTERSDYHLGKACVKRRNRSTMITKAHIIYALLLYQYSGYRCFKWFYFKEMLGHSAPVRWPSYSWFLRLKKRVIGELFAYLKSQNIRKTGVYYIDASALEVCHNKRISQHKTFKGKAERGRTSVGWFYGFKLHLIINDHGHLVDMCFTKGNCDERVALDKMGKHLTGTLCGDKGYISRKREHKLAKRGLRLLTKKRKNMQQTHLSQHEKEILKRRGIIETVFGILKESLCLHSHKIRSITGFIIQALAALTAYQLKATKQI
jgi:Transposase DDE domain.